MRFNTKFLIAFEHTCLSKRRLKLNYGYSMQPFRVRTENSEGKSGRKRKTVKRNDRCSPRADPLRHGRKFVQKINISTTKRLYIATQLIKRDIKSTVF